MPVVQRKLALGYGSLAYLTFEQERFNTCSTTDLQHLCISDSILPLDISNVEFYADSEDGTCPVSGLSVDTWSRFHSNIAERHLYSATLVFLDKHIHFVHLAQITTFYATSENT